MTSKLFDDVYKSSFRNRLFEGKKKKKKINSKLYEITYNIRIDDNGKVSGITIEDDNNELSSIDVTVSEEDDCVDKFLSADD